MKNKSIHKDIREAKTAISLTENFINSLIALVLSPKVKKIEKQLKNDPEYQALEKRAKQIQDELEVINKKLEKVVTERESVLSDMKKAGIKVTPNMGHAEVTAAYNAWMDEIQKGAAMLRKGKKLSPEIKKYFNS